MPKNGRLRSFLHTVFGKGAPSGVDPKLATIAVEQPPDFPLPAEPVPRAASSPAAPGADSAEPPLAAGAAEALAESPDGIGRYRPAPQASALCPPPEPAPQLPVPPPLPPPLPSVSPETIEKLARLPKALHDVAEAINSQTVLNERLQEVFTNLSGPNQELLQALEDLSGEGRRQTDLLQTLAQRLGEARQRDAQSADAVARLPELLESLRLSNTALVEMMEQVRDRWASTKDDLAKEMVRQGRKTTPLVIAILALVGVQTLLLIIQFIVAR